METPSNQTKGFSILIPTWNNLSFLKLCVESINKNSSLNHQLIIHVNEGTDDTLNWVKENQLEYTYSEKNIGVCRAVNQAARKATRNYVVFMNDDMYVLPRWDSFLSDGIQSIKNEMFMLSSTMIEPEDTGNPCVIVADFGKNLKDFKEDKLLKSDFFKADWQGASWPPVLISRHIWNEVNGLSEEFSPGMYSESENILITGLQLSNII